MTTISAVVKIGERKQLQGTHHKYILNEQGEYVCDYCEKTSKNQSTISEHISRLHSKEAGRIEKPFECPTCQKRFNSASIRDQHIHNNHFNIRDNCVAPGCSYKGKTDAALCTHYVRKHMDVSNLCRVIDSENLLCNHCEKSMSKSSMMYHLAKCSPLSPYCKSAMITKLLEPDLTLVSKANVLSAPMCSADKPERKKVDLGLMGIGNKSKPCLKPVLAVDMSSSKPADAIRTPTCAEKVEKKALLIDQNAFQKPRRVRTRRSRKTAANDETDNELKRMTSQFSSLRLEYDEKREILKTKLKLHLKRQIPEEECLQLREECLGLKAQIEQIRSSVKKIKDTKTQKQKEDIVIEDTDEK